MNFKNNIQSIFILERVATDKNKEGHKTHGFSQSFNTLTMANEWAEKAFDVLVRPKYGLLTTWQLQRFQSHRFAVKLYALELVYPRRESITKATIGRRVVFHLCYVISVHISVFVYSRKIY